MEPHPNHTHRQNELAIRENSQHNLAGDLAHPYLNHLIHGKIHTNSKKLKKRIIINFIHREIVQ